MSKPPASPYLVPGFYDRALAQGRHREIVGGRWDETGRVQMQALRDAGLMPHHRLLDIGCGALRLGCKAVPYLNPGHYWGTDASLALMRRGHDCELADKGRLPVGQLVQDADFSFPGIPDRIDLAIAFGLFTHLPPGSMSDCLTALRQRFPRLTTVLFTVFLAPDAPPGAYRQADGVVTHPDRPPYHRTAAAVLGDMARCGFAGAFRPMLLPRGQALCLASPVRNP